MKNKLTQTKPATLNIPIVSKEVFAKMVLDHLINDCKNWTKEEYINYVLMHGFPKLDFDNLGRCLAAMAPSVYLPNVAVETDSEFVWVVAGSSAILAKR